jgi:hypothetical protein
MAALRKQSSVGIVAIVGIFQESPYTRGCKRKSWKIPTIPTIPTLEGHLRASKNRSLADVRLGWPACRPLELTVAPGLRCSGSYTVFLTSRNVGALSQEQEACGTATVRKDGCKC